MTVEATTTRLVPDGIPRINLDLSEPSSVYEHWEELDRLRERAPVYWNEYGPGFWMITDYARVREAYQTPEVFTSQSILVTDPNPQHKWIPTMVDPPDHVKYRQILNTLVSPDAVNRLEPLARERAGLMIDRFSATGSCDAIAEFAGEFPTEIFLGLLGLPMTDAAVFLGWVEAVFDHMFDADQTPMVEGIQKIDGYFRELLGRHRAEPADTSATTDIVGKLCAATIDGVPLSDDDILNICNVLVLAGLDTVKGQLGYSLLHFATHPDDRRRMVAEPDLWPSAVEELLRLYAIVTNDGRKVSKDVDFHGCPMKAGDMVALALGPVCRDPNVFDQPLSFVPDRPANRHLAFAAGPHRCLGSHLARMELKVALDEWHRRIPDYQVVPGSNLTERGGQMALHSLPLEWPR